MQDWAFAFFTSVVGYVLATATLLVLVLLWWFIRARSQLARNVRIRWAGLWGEFKVWVWLRVFFPRWRQWHNVFVAYPANEPHGLTQIDHLAVGPRGVFVIETKNHVGDFEGSRERQALRQNQRHVDAIAGWIEWPPERITNVVASVGQSRVAGNERIRLGLLSFVWHLVADHPKRLSKESVQELAQRLDPRLHKSEGKLVFAHRLHLEGHSIDDYLTELGYHAAVPHPNSSDPVERESNTSDKEGKNPRDSRMWSAIMQIIDIGVPCSVVGDALGVSVQQLTRARPRALLKPTAATYGRAGSPWDDAEELAVTALFHCGVEILQIAQAVGRSEGAIVSRLFVVGAIGPDEAQGLGIDPSRLRRQVH